MSKRIKSTGPVIRSRAEADGMLGKIRAQVITRNELANLREAEIQKVDEQYRDDLTRLDRNIEEMTEQLRGWAEANPSEFAGAKSVAMTHGVIGWRIGNPTLKTLAGWSWDRMLEKLKSAATYAGFVRTKQEVDKASILAMRDSLLDGDLREMGVKVVQDEAFFVDPKIEETENRQVVPAEGAK